MFSIYKNIISFFFGQPAANFNDNNHRTPSTHIKTQETHFVLFYFFVQSPTIVVKKTPIQMNENTCVYGWNTQNTQSFFLLLLHQLIKTETSSIFAKKTRPQKLFISITIYDKWKRKKNIQIVFKTRSNSSIRQMLTFTKMMKKKEKKKRLN